MNRTSWKNIKAIGLIKSPLNSTTPRGGQSCTQCRMLEIIIVVKNPSRAKTSEKTMNSVLLGVQRGGL